MILHNPNLSPELVQQAQTLGFDGIGLLALTPEGTHPLLDQAGVHLENWLINKYNGKMDYMGKHGAKRYQPGLLEPGTRCILALQKHYLTPVATEDKKPQNAIEDAIQTLDHDEKAYITRYALGRDYHKTIRKSLQHLSKWIETDYHNRYKNSSEAPLQRVFVDSAPVMEKALAEAAGLGWIGKHTLLLNRSKGSWFFLGEIYTNLTVEYFLKPEAVPVSYQAPIEKNTCGSCTKCIDVCPTQAIVAPYQLDAKRCISYLTIENKEEIPLEFRKAIGNRIFGCDDCQLFCPWNRFAKYTTDDRFHIKPQFVELQMIDAFQWTAEQFDQFSQGSPIRRTGYQGWIRNLAVALGNAKPSQSTLKILHSRLLDETLTPMVKEHIQWAIQEQNKYLSY